MIVLNDHFSAQVHFEPGEKQADLAKPDEPVITIHDDRCNRGAVVASYYASTVGGGGEPSLALNMWNDQPDWLLDVAGRRALWRYARAILTNRGLAIPR